MHLPMFNSYFISSFPFYPLLSTSIMCFQYIPVVSQKRSYIKRRRQRNLAHLRSISSSLPLSFSMGLWNCQSVVNKADLIHYLQNHTVKRLKNDYSYSQGHCEQESTERTSKSIKDIFTSVCKWHRM